MGRDPEFPGNARYVDRVESLEHLHDVLEPLLGFSFAIQYDGQMLAATLVDNAELVTEAFDFFVGGVAEPGVVKVVALRDLDMGDGVLMRLDEDEFISYEMGANYIAYVFGQGTYDAVGEDLTGTNFLYQVVGPSSLEVLEAATGDDLHDIRFAHFRPSSVDGMEVTALRVGMPGTLAYELHGEAENGPAVYRAVLRAGEPFGIRRLGFRAYLMQHTEGGFPQAFNHFPHPWLEDEGFLKYLEKIGIRSRSA